MGLGEVGGVVGDTGAHEEGHGCSVGWDWMVDLFFVEWNGTVAGRSDKIVRIGLCEGIVEVTP